jgi:transposase
MQRRKFSPEFKVEAVRLVRERGVSAARVARDLDVYENVLRKWVKEFAASSVGAYPGHGQMKPGQLEIECEGLRSIRSRARIRSSSAPASRE